MSQPPTEQQLDEIAGRAAGLYEYATVADPEVQAALDELAGIDAPALLAEVRRLRAKTRTLGELAARRESELIARRAELADAEAEKAKLIRWHCEDGTTLDRMRDTIVRLRAELATAQAAPVAPLSASQGSSVSEVAQSPTGPPEGPLRPTAPPRRTLTPNEYSAAWHAVEGAAGDEGADPGTVLHAVLNRLGIDTPASPRPAVPSAAADQTGQTR